MMAMSVGTKAHCSGVRFTLDAFARTAEDDDVVATVAVVDVIVDDDDAAAVVVVAVGVDMTDG